MIQPPLTLTFPIIYTRAFRWPLQSTLSLSLLFSLYLSAGTSGFIPATLLWTQTQNGGSIGGKLQNSHKNSHFSRQLLFCVLSLPGAGPKRNHQAGQSLWAQPAAVQDTPASTVPLTASHTAHLPHYYKTETENWVMPTFKRLLRGPIGGVLRTITCSSLWRWVWRPHHYPWWRGNLLPRHLFAPAVLKVAPVLTVLQIFPFGSGTTVKSPDRDR